MSASGEPVVLFDGGCGLCSRTVRFLLRHDARGRMRFAPLGSGAAAAVLRTRGVSPADLPDSVPGQGFPATLYPRARALAQDRSAGPDCAGADAAMQAWCAAREANTRLRAAVLPHLLARWQGATADAVTLGWAQEPPPIRPRARAAQP